MLWVLYFILKKIFFYPVKKVIDERDSKLKVNKEAYERALKENELRINEIEESLKSARKSAFQTVDKFEKEALKEKNRMLEEIQIESKSQLEKARKKLEEEVKISKEKLESEAKSLAEKIEKRLLQ